MKNVVKLHIVGLCVCTALLSGCGSQDSGVPESASGNPYDTVITAPTAWDGESSTSQELSSEESEETPVSMSESEDLSESSTRASESVPDQTPELSPEPVEERLIPGIQEVLDAGSSVERTELMRGLMRGNIIVEWGNPYVDAGGKVEPRHDRWILDTDAGKQELHLRYAADEAGLLYVIEAYVRYDGWKDHCWDDMDQTQFQVWAVDEEDPVKTLVRVSDMTRHDVLEVSGQHVGSCANEDGTFAGDVVILYGKRNDFGYAEKVGQIFIRYDKDLGVYPAYMQFIGSIDNKPDLPEGISMMDGKYEY